ncbi:MAG: 5'-methylthioadenosine/adenosylhomocysteine nucleosidase [Verrucomicrobia bacterium]|nr:MAG: 5'-methylthioadenosine/adenosylhomocysteine nucleosidase [Verrucomicrobiota bacterium]
MCCLKGRDMSPKSAAPLGIVAAVEEEITELIGELHRGPMKVVSIGQRNYYVGSLWQQPCVVTLARIGKVAAATTATALIHEFGVRAILFTGVAGGLSNNLGIGDIVIAASLMQHDMDASPLFPRHQIPMLDRHSFSPCPLLTETLTQASRNFIENHPALPRLPSGQSPQIHSGLIVSGDQFISDKLTRTALHTAIPNALAVEMEGGAIAQVCYEYSTPFAVMRTISDTADEGAVGAFSDFLKKVASVYSYGVVRHFLQLQQGG